MDFTFIIVSLLQQCIEFGSENSHVRTCIYCMIVSYVHVSRYLLQHIYFMRPELFVSALFEEELQILEIRSLLSECLSQTEDGVAIWRLLINVYVDLSEAHLAVVERS